METEYVMLIELFRLLIGDFLSPYTYALGMYVCGCVCVCVKVFESEELHNT